MISSSRELSLLSQLTRFTLAQFAIPTNQVYSSGNLGVVIARMQLSAAPAAGTKVGEVKLTWYVRMSTRRLS